MSAQFAVFGQPIAHSLSPRIHAMFGAELGIPVDYRAIEASREDFATRLQRFAEAGGAGANVTLPLKEDAFALCASTSARTQRCGSVNTLIRTKDSWRGDSTDGIGFLRDLHRRHGLDVEGRRCLLLGAGGAARAIAFALADAGVAHVAIANRTLARALLLAGAIDDAARVFVIDWTELDAQRGFDLIVNATSAGHAGALDLPRALAASDPVCYDLSYGNAAQPFLSWARESGAQHVSDGLGMLVEQAAESFAIWHGKTPDTERVHAVLRSELAT